MKKLKVTNDILLKYKAQNNVIRKSGQTNLNYGTIAVLTDADPDG